MDNLLNQNPPPKNKRLFWGILTLVLLLALIFIQAIAHYVEKHWLHKKATKPASYEVRQKTVVPLKAPIAFKQSAILPMPQSVEKPDAEKPDITDDTLIKMRLLERLKEQEAMQKHREEMLGSDGFLVMGERMQTTTTSSDNQNIPQNPNTQYLNSMSNRDVHEIQAIKLGDLRYRILKGTALQGVTESAIDSDLPNIIRAHITQDVYGENSDTALIKNGDKLVGEYRSGDIKNGQARLYVVWTRLILQNGYSINLDSSGSDPLGRAGMAGPLDRHFLERYGSALLMSSISAGSSLVGVSDDARYNSKAMFRQGVSASFAQTATNELQQNMVIQNTIRPEQGTPISILVNHDLSFDSIYKASGDLQ